MRTHRREIDRDFVDFGNLRGAQAGALCGGQGGLSALVRSLAVELARFDIQLNTILPGWIITEATDPARNHEPLNQVVLKRTPARRWGTTEDLEGIAVYLESNASNFHTGDSLRVDGGYSVF